MYQIKIPTSIVESSIELALSRTATSRGDFFHEIRIAFKKNMEKIFMASGLMINSSGTLSHTSYLKQGVHQRWSSIVKYTGWNNDIKQELDFDFCAKYGHDDYSLIAINYLDRTSVLLPSLFSLSGVFSIGNILLLVENKDYKVELSLGDEIRSTGYAYHISKRKKKSYFCLFGIWFKPELINSIIENKLAKHEQTKEEFDEIRLGVISYPMLYIDRVTGNLCTCSCFSGYFDIYNDIERLLPYGNSEEGFRNRIKNLKIMDGLCHFCSGGLPRQEYGHSMYYSSFLQRYLPYHNLLSRIRYGRTTYEGDEYRKVENELREHFGYPKVGQQWVTETMLYKIVVMLFPDFKVIHHYRGLELQGLELDIWLPEINVGIEYQGEQHYKVIEHWGGKEGLEKRMESDRKKKKLCDELGYHLIEFKYTEEITEQLVRKKVSKYIENQV
ncbi:hypothetical protein THII_1606 [Thioploca ingrica]|uniref:Uncharacterized protein n=1 Tax=Thioploca ingrica TaxID=40754 RepID=A0A090ADG6_9GAMM|nr:hypothetical protein THII_1606 [Thioploca ingrica]